MTRRLNEQGADRRSRDVGEPVTCRRRPTWNQTLVQLVGRAHHGHDEHGYDGRERSANGRKQRARKERTHHAVHAEVRDLVGAWEQRRSESLRMRHRIDREDQGGPEDGRQPVAADHARAWEIAWATRRARLCRDAASRVRKSAEPNGARRASRLRRACP